MPHSGLLYTEPLPLWQATADLSSTGDTQTLKGRSGSVSLGSPGVHKALFEPSKCLWQVWGLILNAILPLLLSWWGLSFAPGHGVSFLGVIQHPPVNGCSAVSCNFGILRGEDECMSFYSATLWSSPFQPHLLLTVCPWTAPHWSVCLSMKWAE